MNTICMGRRSHSAVAGLPRSFNPCRAALRFAGNTAIKSAIRQGPATARNRGRRIPMAPAISHTPVKYTHAMLFPSAFGTIAAKSCRKRLKSALAASANIGRNAHRVAAGQELSGATPSAPAVRNKKRDTTRTTRTNTSQILAHFVEGHTSFRWHGTMLTCPYK